MQAIDENFLTPNISYMHILSYFSLALPDPLRTGAYRLEL